MSGFSNPDHFNKKIILGISSIIPAGIWYLLVFKLLPFLPIGSKAPIILNIVAFILIFLLMIVALVFPAWFILGIIGYHKNPYYKIQSKGYTIPWSVILQSVVTYGAIFIPFVIVAVSIKIVLDRVSGIYAGFLISLLFIPFVYGTGKVSSMGFFNAAFYLVRMWILRTIKCPNCGASLVTCIWNRGFQGVNIGFKVYCESCGKYNVLETGSFDKTLKFLK